MALTQPFIGNNVHPITPACRDSALAVTFCDMNRKTTPRRAAAQPRPPETFLPGDREALPPSVESSSETAWAMFNEISARHEVHFAPTAPAGLPLKKTDARYADTEPASLHHAPPPRSAVVRDRVKADDLLEEIRRNHRVCLKPDAWMALYDMLPHKTQRQPTPPLVGDAWDRTPNLAKRTCLREQVRWAQRVGVLPEVLAFLRAQPEDAWHHAGE